MQDPNLQFAMPYQQGVQPQTNINPNFKNPAQPNQPYPPYPLPPSGGQVDNFEESYIENILRLNRGKTGTFYYTYSDSLENRDKVYQGVIEAAGRDHIIISDLRDGKRYILLTVYLNWVEFNEEINYEYPIR